MPPQQAQAFSVSGQHKIRQSTNILQIIEWRIFFGQD